jgi:hypothetical protein
LEMASSTSSVPIPINSLSSSEPAGKDRSVHISTPKVPVSRTQQHRQSRSRSPRPDF